MLALSLLFVAVHLQCEYRVEPLGIDTPRPRLSWTIDAPGRDQRQSAYQILVATSPEKLAVGDAWNSGKVNSSETNQVEYAGAPLQPATRYYWKVRAWDAAGKPGSWSATATWTMGLPSAADWKAQWISWKDTQGPNDPLPVFRKQIRLAAPKRAIVFVSGLGQYELRINGTRVGNQVLDPGWTNYRKTILYSAYDVTPLLASGENALAAMLGNGMFNVVGGRYIKFKGSFGVPRLILQLHIENADGSTTIVASDETWKAAAGPITFSCIYGGEDYDARREMAGWDKPGFDDGAWQAARVVESPGGALVAQSAPPVRVMQTFRTVKTTEPAPGVRIYDLGQNFSGWPKVIARGQAGATVKMIPGELLDEKGFVNQRSSGRGNSFSYTLSGKGLETWTPRFSYYGFRYVQVETNVADVRIEGEFTYSSARETGAFQSSNDLLNRIHKLVHMAIRSNLQSVLTDCPHREKLGWLEVAHLLGPSILFGYDAPALYAKITRDAAEAQTAEGLVPDIAPEFTVFKNGFRDSPEWGSASVILPWMLYEWYGDRRVLRDRYDTMRRYAEYLDRSARSGVVEQGLGDWYDIGPGEPGPSKLTTKGVTGTAIQYQNWRILARAARLLDKPEESSEFARRAETARSTFEKAFFHVAEGYYATNSQTANAMPLALGIPGDEARPRVLENLTADIRKRGNHTSAGDVGYRYVIRALTDSGRSDVLYDMATQTDPPSYGAQLKMNATSLTEAWDANPRSSQNHCMLGHIQEWFYTGLVGINPDPSAPGFANVLIRPQPAGDLTWVKGHYNSIRGRIESEWKRAGKEFTLRVRIPANVSATVTMPGPSHKIHKVGSGEHTFRETLE